MIHNNTSNNNDNNNINLLIITFVYNFFLPVFFNLCLKKNTYQKLKLVTGYYREKDEKKTAKMALNKNDDNNWVAMAHLWCRVLCSLNLSLIEVRSLASTCKQLFKEIIIKNETYSMGYPAPLKDLFLITSVVCGVVCPCKITATLFQKYLLSSNLRFGFVIDYNFKFQLFLNYLPQSLITLILPSGFLGRLDGSILPRYLENISVNSKCLKTCLNKIYIPFIDSLPASIKSVTLPHVPTLHSPVDMNYEAGRVETAPNIKTLHAEFLWNLRNTQWPPDLTSLTELVIVNTIDCAQTGDSCENGRAFPPNLRILHVFTSLASLSNLPRNLVKLVVEGVKSISNLPPTLECLQAFTNTHFDALPPSIRCLKVPYESVACLDKLPAGLTRLAFYGDICSVMRHRDMLHNLTKFSGKASHLVNHLLPPNLKECSFTSVVVEKLFFPTIPKVEKLKFIVRKKFFKLLKMMLPVGEHFCEYWKSLDTALQHLPQTITRLYFGDYFDLPIDSAIGRLTDLKELSLGKMFSHNVSNLPNSISLVVINLKKNTADRSHILVNEIQFYMYETYRAAIIKRNWKFKDAVAYVIKTTPQSKIEQSIIVEIDQ